MTLAGKQPTTAEGRSLARWIAPDVEHHYEAERRIALVEAEARVGGGHRFETDHDCFAADCVSLGREVRELHDILARRAIAEDEA